MSQYTNEDGTQVLKSVNKFQRQIVAGVNYRFNLEIKITSTNGDETVRSF